MSIMSLYPESLTKSEESVISVLRPYGDWMTAPRLQTALPDLSLHTINNALVRLARRGYVESVREEKGSPKKWRIIE